MRPADVISLFDRGVAAFASQAQSVAPAEWTRPACGSWSVEEVARHVLAVVTWYHRWLDRAEEGLYDRPFPAEELADRNAAELASLVDLPGPAAVEQFVTDADRYADRLSDNFDLAYGYPFGTVTAGLHAGVAAVEWNLHTWDVAAAIGLTYEPADAGRLMRRAAACLGTAEGGVGGALIRIGAPAASLFHPWRQLLDRSGRGLHRPEMGPADSP
ncbi:MAG: maleylpyruvate isomerase family mycothiol-dependent enzyme [Acidimicrobiia bacterium]